MAEYLEANDYFGMDGVSVVDPNKGIEEGQVLKQIVLTWQTKALGFKDRKLTKAINKDGGIEKYKLNYQPLGHGWVHPDFGKIGLTEYFTEKLGPEARTIFFQASNPVVWNGIMQAMDETFSNDDDLNVIAVSVKPGEPVGRLVLANGELTNIEYNYFDKGAVKEHFDGEGNSEYGGNINVFIVKNAPYVEVVNDKNNWVEGVNKVFAWLYNPKLGKVIRPETNMQDIYRFFKKVGVTILDRFFVFAAVKNDLVEAQKAVAKSAFPEDTMSVLGMKWRAFRRTLSLSGLKFTGMTDPIMGEKKVLYFKGDGARQYTYTSPLTGAATTQDISPVEQKSGYVLVKDAPGWDFEIKEPGNYEIGSDGQLKKLDQAMIHSVQFTLQAQAEFFKGVRAGRNTNANLKTDAAVNGGIDLAAKHLNMESSGQKVNITFDPAMIEQFKRGDFSGVKIQILDVVPVNLMPLLGLKEDEEPGQLAKAI